MLVEVLEATHQESAILRRMAQLYQYDFTEFDGNDLNPEGLFPYVDTDSFFARSDGYVYLACVDGKPAGFALVNLRPAQAAGVGSVWYMNEFFVMRKYRRCGVGTKLAVTVFDGHRGMWEVAQLKSNTPAQEFWRKTIDRYTDGEFREVELDDEDWEGPLQFFSA